MSDHLSEDLVIEIFTRLPPKSLIRFRSVSKSLCSRIATPDFIRLNMIRSCRIPEKVLLKHRIPHEVAGTGFYYNEDFYTLHSEYQLPLSPDHGYDGVTPINFPFPLESYADVVGSCNGIMCMLHDERYFTLWNPSIRRKLTLPEYPLRETYIIATGFAFDRDTEDYKIVTLSENLNDGMTYSLVYTMNTRTWCQISTPVTPATFITREGRLVNIYEINKGYLANLYETSEGHLVNGVLHWVIRITNERRSANILHYILTFDVSTNVFGTMELPRQKYSKITTIDGSLAVITYKFAPTKEIYAKIWVRKETNDTSPKWVAYFSFRVDSYASVMPLSSRKGILLLKYVRYGIQVYNDWTRERSRLVKFSDSSNINDMSWFVESLELLDTGSPYEESKASDLETAKL